MSAPDNERRRTKCGLCGKRRLVYVREGCRACCVLAYRQWLIDNSEGTIVRCAR
jgi:hypothetical protein